MAFTNYMAQGLQNYLSAPGVAMPVTPAPNLFLALHDASPDADALLGEIAAYGGYARTPIILSPTAGADSQDLWNDQPVIFPVATANGALPILYYSIWDAQVAGNPICWGALDAATNWVLNSQIALATNLLRVQMPTSIMENCTPAP